VAKEVNGAVKMSETPLTPSLCSWAKKIKDAVSPWEGGVSSPIQKSEQMGKLGERNRQYAGGDWKAIPPKSALGKKKKGGGKTLYAYLFIHRGKVCFGRRAGESRWH